MTYLGPVVDVVAVVGPGPSARGSPAGLGIGRGDVVSFLDKNHPACVELTFACSMVGAANAIINFRLAGDEVDYAVNDAGSKLLLVGTELMPLVEKLRDRLPHVEHVIEVTPDGGDGDEYEALLAAATPVDRDPAVTPDDVVPGHVLLGHDRPPQGRDAQQANMLAHTVNAHDGWAFEDGDKSTSSRCRSSTSAGRRTCCSASTTASPA